MTLLCSSQAGQAQIGQAPVEVRVPQTPQLVAGSDGLVHLAYELHVTNFYSSTGTLHLQQVTVAANDALVPVRIAQFTAAQVNTLLAHPTEKADTLGVPLEAGKRVVLFLWLTFPTTQPYAHELRHQLRFVAADGSQQLVDGILTPVRAKAPVVLNSPLRSGPWLAYEGPGNHLSHHWGSIVAVNGYVTIPQRYAIDFFGLTSTGYAIRRPRIALSATTHADWVGFGADVLAVADGVVRDARDGEPDHEPLTLLSAPTDLTVRSLMGNFVVLEIAPHIFIHYAHLQSGSLLVKVGDRVATGTVLARLGQSGNANAPHLHFQVSDAATFEEAEGLPFVFHSFDRIGSVGMSEALNPAVKSHLKQNASQPYADTMPLDSDVVVFK